mmetsp:Transcript_25569/g.21425  ORF Transcript_25569/g.21425 Transcript_25569/m.21425 type:complete len:129 (+) Transcript_25569:496-882(+)
MEIDDFIPCEPKNWWDDHAKPLFAQSKGLEIYVNLIEKAFAKFAGNYSNLIGGSMIKALVTMTGSEKNIIWELDKTIATCKYYDISKEREKNTNKSQFFQGGMCFKGRPSFMSSDECDYSVDFDTLFK